MTTPAVTLFGLDLRDRRVLVTGGGPAAAEAATQLFEAGARPVVVVATHICEDLRDLAVTGTDETRAAAVALIEREPQPEDLDGAWLAIAADDGPVERQQVAQWATDRRIWCITSGATPGAAAGTAQRAHYTHVAGVTVGVVAEPDDAETDGAAAASDRAAAEFDRAAAVSLGIGALLDAGSLDLRRAVVPGNGRVTLVGGGPGAPELITVAGRRALAQADVVVTDRLGPRNVLSHMSPGVEVIDVGKSPGHHPVPQHEINRILVEQAQRGRAVVRLKGGDPFLFGRGGEEVIACREAGVPVEVVPGVSSAFSVPALAGIPVTQRNIVAAVHVASGHEPLAAAALACVRDRSATLVVLMGVGNLGHIVEQLRGAGADLDTAVAIVERGSTLEERVTRARLAEIVEVAAMSRVCAPAVIVIGAVAAPEFLDPVQR